MLPQGIRAKFRNPDINSTTFWPLIRKVQMTMGEKRSQRDYTLTFKLSAVDRKLWQISPPNQTNYALAFCNC
ncbi:hypothetical protein ABIA60_002398 [Pseudomonas frederiksbergensis]